jgi:diguanylate cyclase (GGDEF)-like protein
LNNFFVRLLLIIFVGFFVITAAFNSVFPSMVSSHQDKIAQKLAAELAQKVVKPQAPVPAPAPVTAPGKKKGKKAKGGAADAPVATPVIDTKPNLPAVPVILERMTEHHLSWYYLTDGQGHVNPLTKSFSPDLDSIQESSRKVVWRTGKYYESVAPVAAGYNLHVGFYSGDPIGLSRDPIEEEVPFAAAMVLLGFSVLSAVILYLLSVALPTMKLANYCKQKDSGTGISPGRLYLPGAVNEVLHAAALVESKYRVIDERDEAIRDRDNQLRKANSKFEQEMNQAKKEKTVLYLKEAENQFVDRLSGLYEGLTNVASISDALLTQLHQEFPSLFEYALFFFMNKKQEASLVSHIGFQNNPLEVYKGLGLIKGLDQGDSENATAFEPAKLGVSQFKEIAELTSADQVILVPVRYQGRRLGLMVVFFRGPAASMEHIMRVLGRAAHATAKSMHHIVVYEEQVEAARTDELTGLPNKAYLPHLLPQLLAAVDGADGEKRPFSIFLVEGHDILAINEKYGRNAGDGVIQELAKRINKLLELRRTETMGSWGDHLLRYQGAQFLVILRQVDSKKGVIFAQRLRQVVEDQDYPHGVGRWNVSIGITSFPEDSTSPDELIMNVETALSYARGQSERNKIAHITNVPKAFRSAKLASNLGGTLDVFDPAALMQSLSISRKSGILTVTHPEGKMFWCFLENGKPTKARMGKFTGSAAIIEFLVLFDSGEFAFSDLTSIDKQTLDDIGKLPKSFDVPGSLERALMDGALARDHFTSAQDLIKETNLFVWPQPRAKNGEGFAAMKAMKDPPSPEEEKAMKEILAVANGKVQLKTIMEKLDNLPTHTVWRGAALLVQNEMVQLKKLATSIAL